MKTYKQVINESKFDDSKIQKFIDFLAVYNKCVDKASAFGLDLNIDDSNQQIYDVAVKLITDGIKKGASGKEVVAIGDKIETALGVSLLDDGDIVSLLKKSKN